MAAIEKLRAPWAHKDQVSDKELASLDREQNALLEKARQLLGVPAVTPVHDSPSYESSGSEPTHSSSSDDAGVDWDSSGGGESRTGGEW